MKKIENLKDKVVKINEEKIRILKQSKSNENRSTVIKRRKITEINE